MLFFKFISILPFKILYYLSDGLAFLLCNVVKYRKKVVLSNLKNSFPEKSGNEINEICGQFYRNLSDVSLETIKLLTIKEDELLARLEVHNADLVNELIEKYGVVLMVSSHQCNWEWQGQVAHFSLNKRLEAVYKPLSNLFFDKLLLRIRSRFGLFPIQMKQVLREMIKRKSIKRAVGLIADQVPEIPEAAFWVDFMNQDTPFFNGAEKLARSFSYPVVYADMRRINRGKYLEDFEVLALPPYNQLPENEITKLFANRLEKTIKQNPSDWLWSHRRWKYQRKETVNL